MSSTMLRPTFVRNTIDTGTWSTCCLPLKTGVLDSIKGDSLSFFIFTTWLWYVWNQGGLAIECCQQNMGISVKSPKYFTLSYKSSLSIQLLHNLHTWDGSSPLVLCEPVFVPSTTRISTNFLVLVQPIIIYLNFSLVPRPSTRAIYARPLTSVAWARDKG